MEQLFGGASLISVLVSLTALAGFVYSRARSAKDQGALEEKVRNLKEANDQAWAAIHKIDDDQNDLGKVITRVETELKSIESWLERIDAKLEDTR